MNYSYPFKGFGVALVTPFKIDGQIDFETLTRIVDNLISGGVDYLCLLGTTAETPTLNTEERQQIVKHVTSQVNRRIPILVGCGGNCTANVVNELKQYDLDGVDGILSIVPYYNKPSQEGMYRHFCEIAKASTKPLVLYNVPGRTGVNMSAATTLKLAREFPQIIGVKEASGNMEQINEIIAGAPENFRLISGDDYLAMEVIRNGAAGVISVIGNAIPNTFGKVIHLSKERRFDEAATVNSKLEPLYGLMFREGSPCGVKALMSSRGMLENVLRLPLVPVSRALNDEIVEKFKNIT
jgi:4-hydroxy-tetrahydrodipicolinate synthase